ncbi:MAG TPA: hypothetical protein VN253_07830 [Kofleriaceae bacterium]|nr:hypothetical protein [Kofleriaceae bacterium]
MTNRRIRVAAGVVALVYVAIQAFQDYVYRVMPTPETPLDELLQGAEPLHVVRSTLMLFAMFGLIFVYGTLCAQRLRARPMLAAGAFAGFFVFGLLEIGLRSVELFWTQLQLPVAYAASHDPAIVDQLATFQAIQGALYFPLSFSTLLGSVALFFLFETPPRLNYVIKAIAVFNILRIGARMMTGYAGVELFPTAAYEQMYLGMVVVFYVPAAYWLFRVSDE